MTPKRRSVSRISRGGHYAEVNGLRMYYEVEGEGRPLVLLHGGVGSTDLFRTFRRRMGASHRFISLDLQGHGRTADVERPLRYESLADDVAGLIQYLGLGAADILGYSLGGGVALRVALQHPRRVRKLVLVSAPFRRDGWYPEIRRAMAQDAGTAVRLLKDSPMHRAYLRVAPRKDGWPRLLAKLNELLSREYDWSRELRRLSAPVLIAIGDADSVRTSHAVEFYERLGGGRRDGGWDGSGIPESSLVILPRTTHYEICDSPFLPLVVSQFLDP